MRLAFVLFSWFPHGGLQRDLVKVVEACRSDAAISIYCMAWEGERIAGVDTIVLPARGWSAVARRADFVRQVNAATMRGFDAVVGFNRMPGLDYYYAADTCFAERARKKGWWYRLTPRARQYLAFESAVFSRAASTVSLLLSPMQREQYERHYGTPPGRLVDLPPGIGREHRAGPDAAKLRQDLRAEFGIGDDDLLVLQVGSSFKTKGVVRSFAALAALPEDLKRRTHYFLVGRDDSGPWLAQAQATGLGERVRFFQALGGIPRFMQGADILLHPSLHESAGMVLLEAVVAGLPVLTTASCGYAYHVEQAQAGIVCAEPFAQEELNRNLEKMLRADRGDWRAHGIRYGQTHELYDMPGTVARMLLGGKH